MSDDDLFFEGEGKERSDRSFRQKGPFDFFRAHRERTAKTNSACSLMNKEQSGDILCVVMLMKRLVAEYAATAERVGTALGAPLLHRVVDALQKESFGEPTPLQVPQPENATAQFLAESLYGELLEVPVLPGLSGASNAFSLSSNDWRICLDLLADSLPETTKFDFHAN